MTFCDRAAVCLLLAVAGLVHFVVLFAVGVDTSVKTAEAKVAPVACPVGVKILDMRNDGDLLITVQDVINIILGEDVVAHSSEVSTTPECAFRCDFPTWNTRRHYNTSVVRVDGKSFITDRGKPLVGIVRGIATNEYFSQPPSVEGRSLPEIDQTNVYPHSLSRYNLDIRRIENVAVPNIWSLVSLKLLPIVRDRFSQQTCLPTGDPGIEKHSQERKPFQPHFLNFTSPVLCTFGAVCGCILLAFGSVLLLLVYWRMGSDSATNSNIVLAIRFVAAAACFLIGQYCLFSALGLTP